MMRSFQHMFFLPTLLCFYWGCSDSDSSQHPEKGIGDGGLKDGAGSCVHPKVEKNCADGWCTIPAGCFTMGSPGNETCRVSGEVQHQVTLTHAFEMSEAEVILTEYQGLLGPSGKTSCGDPCPAVDVNWNEAVGYCNALSKQKGLTECYSCAWVGNNKECTVVPDFAGAKIYDCPGFRLPTEAEWEYAYRAGTTTSLYNGDIKSCAGSDPNANQIGWYDQNSQPFGNAAKGLAPNAWGLYDMAGNAMEWCHDIHQKDLTEAPVTDPWGAATGTEHVLRGGSWNHPASDLRAAARSWNHHLGSYNYTGLRCVRTKSR